MKQLKALRAFINNIIIKDKSMLWIIFGVSFVLSFLPFIPFVKLIVILICILSLSLIFVKYLQIFIKNNSGL